MSTAVALAEFRRWLISRAVEMPGVQVGIGSTRDPDGFATVTTQEGQRRTARKFLRLPFSGGREATMAVFPMSTGVIDVFHVIKEPNRRRVLGPLLEEGSMDEHEAVILHLAVERVRGESSMLHPWIRLLPEELDTTLFWSDDELKMLQGTALHRATALRRRSLQTAWRRLEPVSGQLLLAAEENLDESFNKRSRSENGLTVSLEFEDFLWASAVYWSRAIKIPLEMSTNIDNYGIVPGLDFCNHDPTSICRWKIEELNKAKGSSRAKRQEKNADETDSSQQSDRVSGPFDRLALQLVCPVGSKLLPGDEITIDYGDKSNEQLLFLYGFVQEDNPNDTLMIACPLPPREAWDDLIEDRIALLRKRGLTPQIFLTAAHINRYMKHEEVRRRRHQLPRSGPVKEDELPQGVARTLEVFILESRDVVKELNKECDAMDVSNGEDKQRTTGGLSSVLNRRKASDNPQGQWSTSSLLEASGARMAWLTTLSRLLELKCEELESTDQGTGSLESDDKRLAETDRALNHREKMAIIYRRSQKKLARDYLKLTRTLLKREIDYLTSLM